VAPNRIRVRKRIQIRQGVIEARAAATRPQRASSLLRPLVQSLNGSLDRGLRPWFFVSRKKDQRMRIFAGPLGGGSTRQSLLPGDVGSSGWALIPLDIAHHSEMMSPRADEASSGSDTVPLLPSCLGVCLGLLQRLASEDRHELVRLIR
jgi:hypothetical protein